MEGFIITKNLEKKQLRFCNILIWVFNHRDTSLILIFFSFFFLISYQLKSQAWCRKGDLLVGIVCTTQTWWAPCFHFLIFSHTAMYVLPGNSIVSGATLNETSGGGTILPVGHSIGRRIKKKYYRAGMFLIIGASALMQSAVAQHWMEDIELNVTRPG